MVKVMLPYKVEEEWLVGWHNISQSAVSVTLQRIAHGRFAQPGNI
jgi:hypothetical protein